MSFVMIPVFSIVFIMSLVGASVAPWPECKWFTLAMMLSGIALLLMFAPYINP